MKTFRNRGLYFFYKSFYNCTQNKVDYVLSTELKQINGIDNRAKQ
jgi:hypothetical protein